MRPSPAPPIVRAALALGLVALLGLLPGLVPPAVGAAPSFDLYINNRPVPAADPVAVAPDAQVTFTVRVLASPPAAVTVDPTGQGELERRLPGAGPVFEMTTSYRAGTYEPRITVGPEIRRMKLTVAEAPVGWATEIGRGLRLIPAVATWPVVVLVLLLILLPTIRRLIPNLQAVKIGGTEILIRDLENSMRQAIQSTVRTLERVFPPGKADKYMPSSVPDVAYYVHVAEFLVTLDVPIKSAAVWNAVGAYYFIRDEEKARRAFERSIALDPDDPAGYITLGFWHLRLQRDLNAARTLFLQSLDKASGRMDAPWAHVGLAAVARDLGDLPTHVRERNIARTDLERALARDPTDFWALHGLAWVSAHEGDNARARAEMERALSLKPDFDAVRYNLACVHARMGNPAGAVAALRAIVSAEACVKLEHLGVPFERDFQPMKTDPNFTAFMGALGLVYRL